MKSLTTIGNIVIGTFVTIVIVSIVVVIFDLAYIVYVRSIVSGDFVDEEKAKGIENCEAVIHTLQFILRISCGIVFLIWFYRSHKNLAESGWDGLRFTSKWTVVGFFIPFLNFVCPYQVKKEVWFGSATLYHQRMEVQVAVSPSSSLVGWWWTFFLAAAVLGNISGRLMPLAESPSQFLVGYWVMFASDLLDIPAAIAALFLVRRINEFQEQFVNRPVSFTALFPTS